MEWFILMTAILLEIGGTTSMKLSRGFTRLAPTLSMLVFYAAGFALLTLALRKIDIGVAYAIWSGVGTALIALIGVIYFREPVSPLKILSLGLIVLGVVGLKLSGGSH
jgi:small multidrug resistance pump